MRIIQGNRLKESIYAPATSVNKAGIIVVRVSGPHISEVISHLQAKKPQHKCVEYAPIYHPITKELIDNAVLTFFENPHSFTGEDVLEISIHGSRAVLNHLMQALSSVASLRLADAGEFSLRAFLNGKMDLTQVEGLADLIDAETCAQSKQALKQLAGNLSGVYEAFGNQLLYVMSLTEALIDFPDEEIPDSTKQELTEKINKLKSDIARHLEAGKHGERLRDGFYVAIVGPVNAGKSSLMNKLAKREVAIVSNTAGTTRDVIEVHLDLDGYPVILADTAGIRESEEEVEKEGIKRSMDKIRTADLKIVVLDANHAHDESIQRLIDRKTIVVHNKIDTLPDYHREPRVIAISTLQDKGIDALLGALKEHVREFFDQSNNTTPITRYRYKELLEQVLAHLEDFSLGQDIEIAAECLRLAAHALGRITGKFDVESLLGEIFSKFCIGK